MYHVSTDLSTALETQRQQLFIVTDTGGELEPYSLTYTASCGGGESIGIGSVCAAMVRCKVWGKQDLQDVPISVRIGVEAGGTVRSIPLGQFVVTTQERGEDSTTITAYDAAYCALGGDYTAEAASGATVAEVLADIAGQCGLALAPLPAGADTTAVEGDLTGHTCRDMVGYLAALVGCNAVIDRDGALRLIWFSDNGQTATGADYYSGGLSLAGETRLAGVRMTRTVKQIATNEEGIAAETETTETYDAGEGSGTVIAVENPFATQAVVDAVWAAIGGFGSYRAGSCTVFGGVCTEPGDLVRVTDGDGATSVLPVMSVTLELDGGCKCTISAAGQSVTDAAAGVQGPTGKALTKLEADIAAFKQLSADQLEALEARMERLYAQAADINIAKIGGFLVQDNELYSDGTYTNEGGFTVDTALHLKAANANGDDTPPSLTFGQVGGMPGIDYTTMAQLTVGGGGTRASGISAFDWVRLSATDVEQGLEAYIRLWAKNRLVEIGGDSVSIDGAVAVGDRVYSKGNIYTGSRRVYNDGVAGCSIGNAGTISLCSAGTANPGVYFYRHNATAVTASIIETADGTLAVNKHFTVPGTLTVGGWAVPKLQRGSVSVSAAANSHTEFTITFPNAFSSAPNVQLTVRHNSTTNFLCHVKTVTAAAAVCDLYNPGSSTANPVVSWLAAL